MTCVGGFTTSVGGNNVTCQEACDGGCCLGNGTASNGGSPNYAAGDLINSCTLFNGMVCKSGAIQSCSDNSTSGRFLGRACYRANITEVVNGCNGIYACNEAGLNGDLGRVVNSCIGYESCSGAAYSGGYIKEIVDSCIGKEACEFAAGGGGYIKEIVDSCVGVESCKFAAYYYYEGGNIGYINHGCRGVKACYGAAYYYRSIDGISYACNNISACEYLAYGDEGIKGNGPYNSVNSAVVSCCNGASECTGSIVNASGLPVTCEGISASPTSSPTTEVRMLSHALYNML